MVDFFISYNKSDRNWAEWIAWQLEQAGYSTILDALDFRPGSNFALEIWKAAAESDRTIAVLSPDYVSSRFSEVEWSAALARDPINRRGTLLPVRVRECELPESLRPFVYIDLVGRSQEAARDALLTGVASSLRKKDAKFREQYPWGGDEIGKRKDRLNDGESRVAETWEVSTHPVGPLGKVSRYPGSPPDIWNVPHPRNPRFIGRSELLSDLHAAFSSGRCRQALVGLGGVGKTQLAVEYAYRYMAEYSVVWWLHAEEPATLASEYAALAGRLGLVEQNQVDLQTAVNAVQSWLERHGDWLLILDDARDPSECSAYIPRATTGHILVTSRNPNWRDSADPFRIGPLARGEATEFLQKRTRQNDLQAIASLCHALGDLPLALEQAAAYIETAGVSIAEYLTRFQNYTAVSPSEGDPHSIATAWKFSFDRLQREVPEAMELLSLLAFLAPDDIPRDLLVLGRTHLQSGLCAIVSDTQSLHRLLTELQRHSLIDVRGDALFVHQLVQAVARDRLAGQNTEGEWASAAVRVVAEAFPFQVNETGTWSGSARLVPQALTATQHAERLGVALKETGLLLNQVGLYLRSRAQLAAAEEVLRRALRIDEQVYGLDDPNVAISASNIGAVLQAKGDLEGALRYTQRALATAERVYGSDHPSVATLANNIGAILQEQGDLDGALQYTQRALAIDERVFGPDNPNVAVRTSNIGVILKNQGDLTGALRYAQRALAIAERAYGQDHPTVATLASNIGAILQAQGDLSGALQYTQRALAIDEKVYGSDHPEIATVANNIGQILRAQGDLESARRYTQRALAIAERVYGPDHPSVATRVNNLGQILQDQGDIEGARRLTERALAIFEKAYGASHPTTTALAAKLRRMTV